MAKKQTATATVDHASERSSYPLGTMLPITFHIVGLTPLLQHSTRGMTTTKTTGAIEVKKEKNLTSEQEAELGTYPTQDGRYYHPGDAFRDAIITAVVGTKIGKKSAPEVFGFSLFVLSEQCVLIHPTTGEPLTTYAVDIRTVVNPTTGGRMPCARPRWDEWATQVVFEYDPNSLSPRLITDGLTLAGVRVGVGAFRPTPKKNNPKRGKGGRFGKFRCQLEE